MTVYLPLVGEAGCAITGAMAKADATERAQERCQSERTCAGFTLYAESTTPKVCFRNVISDRPEHLESQTECWAKDPPFSVLLGFDSCTGATLDVGDIWGTGTTADGLHCVATLTLDADTVLAKAKDHCVDQDDCGGFSIDNGARPTQVCFYKDSSIRLPDASSSNECWIKEEPPAAPPEALACDPAYTPLAMTGCYGDEEIVGGPDWPSAGTSPHKSMELCAEACDAREGCSHYLWSADKWCKTYTSCDESFDADPVVETFLCEREATSEARDSCEADALLEKHDTCKMCLQDVAGANSRPAVWCYAGDELNGKRDELNGKRKGLTNTTSSEHCASRPACCVKGSRFR